MCVLSGCDYLANIPGIGLAKAKRLVAVVWNSESLKSKGSDEQFIKLV
jgi:5'-3' exonuclease